MAAGEHGDREIPGVERVDQVGEQLTGGAGVGIEEAVHDQEALAPDPVGPQRFGLEPVELLAEGHHLQRAADDAQVEQGAGVAHVPAVERASLFDAQPVAAVHLGPAGDPGPNRDPVGDPVRQVARQERPRSDQRHLAPQHVKELRDLVEPRAPQHASDQRDPLAVRDRYPLRVAGAAHGPELVEGERAHAPARTQLAEQDRAALVQEHDERDQPEQGQEREEGERAHAHLEGTAGTEVDAIARAWDARVPDDDVRRRQAQDVGQEVELHAVPGAAPLGEGPHLRRQTVSGPGHHEALRLDALDREIGDDPIEVLRLAEDRYVMHVAPARGARILDDAHDPQVGPRRRLDRADEQGRQRAAAIQQHGHILRGRRAQRTRARAPGPGLREPVSEPRAAQQHDQDQPLDDPYRRRHLGHPSARQADGDEQENRPCRRPDDRAEIADRGVAPDAPMQTEGEKRCRGQSEKQRHGVAEEPNVGPDQLATVAQHECQHERRQRRRQVMSEDDDRPRDRRPWPSRHALQVAPALFWSSQQW